ncbi:nucleotidyltransferase/DNA polymerase involved in DNA repair [Croceifilum oryzae]|uniref:DNA polymerase IV n=1 Tax=Croceifilum oryzae TaxID=1553429 RepID=A0AAJ1WUC5_9BACL|nr:DNA polymerase IV [Croceifilum oryzae]MDQ0418948.1 nucleotidyltransferase/DNA polymerase involved in DNA repair [Croceifilum oryzae]
MILLVDMESFYCSVEKSLQPDLWNKPTVVAGDPERRSGIVLAACPLSKAYGIKTAQSLWEALQKCPHLVVVRPRMQLYIDISLRITKILERFSDRVEPYSIDEIFVDVSGCERLFGSPKEIATKIQDSIRSELHIRARVGIGPTKVLAKMACDQFAKKNFFGICQLDESNIKERLWPLPIGAMFGVGNRMRKHFERIRIQTIGQLANYPLSQIKSKWGINGHVLWLTAHGIDSSPVASDSFHQPKGIGHQMTLPCDYRKFEGEIDVVLLELCENVCRRVRQNQLMGRTVHIGARGADFGIPTGFYRQLTMPGATNETMLVYQYAREVFQRHWDQAPIRVIGLSLSNFQSDEVVQLDLFDQKKEQRKKLGYVIDGIKERYGASAVIRASSLTKSGQALERHGKIGGHFK